MLLSGQLDSFLCGLKSKVCVNNLKYTSAKSEYVPQFAFQQKAL